MHSRHLAQGRDAASAAYHRILAAKDQLLHSAEAAGFDARVDLRDQLGRGKRMMHRGQHNLEHLAEEGVHHARSKPLVAVGLAALAAYFLYQVFERK